MKKSGFKKMLAGISAICLTASAMPAVIHTASAADVVYGDANCNGTVELADAVLILQSLANASAYGVNGTNELRITAKGMDNADVYERGSGLTPMDALSIQKYLVKLTDLPESYREGYTETDPVTDAVYIHLNGTSISVEGDENAYTSVSGSKITISHSGTYYVDGTLDDGQIDVNIPDEAADPETVKIFLNGASITGKSDSPFLVTNAENTSINLVDGTENTLSDGDTAYTSGTAVIMAKDDLTIKGGDEGTGTLIITANTQDGIVCNNDLKINGGVVDVTASSAEKKDGIVGKKSVTVKSGSVKVKAEGDGIKSSKGSIEVSGGSVKVKAGNDAVQASVSIDISGGNIVAGGDRGFRLDTDGKLNITGGIVLATATDYQVDGNEAIDLSGITQSTMLLDMAEEQTKDATIERGDIFEPNKKYNYALISSANIPMVNTAELLLGGAVAEHDGGNTTFGVAEGYVKYKEVKVASGETVNPLPDIDEGYTITLDGASIQTNAPADVAKVNGGVITIVNEGVFTVTGSGKEGQIVVDVDKTAYPEAVVELDLAGMSLSNTSDSPVYVNSIGDEVQIVAKNGTENTISDGKNYTNADGDQGAIYSKEDLKFKGKGTLTVNGNATDAIVSKDDIKIYNGNLVVNAVDDGIRGKDSVRIGNPDDAAVEGAYANLSVTVKTNNGSTGGDGIKATNDSDEGKGYVEINGGKVEINSYADGIQGEQAVTVNGGDITIYTYSGSGYTGSGSSTGGNTGWGGGFGGMGGGFGGMQDGNSNKTDISAKGIKAVGLYDANGTTWQSAGDITINGGTFNIDSSDDAVHCGGDMKINGGVFTVATADDGFHSDKTLTIGKTAANTFDDVQIYISKCYEGVEAPTINQNSGSVYVISTDDGYNAGGGSDGSGNGGFGGPGGNWGQGASSSNSNIVLNINGGFVCVNSASGDHDAFDSNGDINLNDGYVCANGREPLDCGDNGNVINYNGTNAIVMTSGNTALNTRYSFVDTNGNIIVSFFSANAKQGIGFKGCTTCTVYSEGTVSGGTTIMSLPDNKDVTIGGTLSDGTKKS